DVTLDVCHTYIVTYSTLISILSLHDALPIYRGLRIHRGLGSAVPPASQFHVPDEWLRGYPRLHLDRRSFAVWPRQNRTGTNRTRSEEHTSELQSRFDLVCRLLLDKYHILIYY